LKYRKTTVRVHILKYFSKRKVKSNFQIIFNVVKPLLKEVNCVFLTFFRKNSGKKQQRKKKKGKDEKKRKRNEKVAVLLCSCVDHGSTVRTFAACDRPRFKARCRHGNIALNSFAEQFLFSEGEQLLHKVVESGPNSLAMHA